MSELDDYQMPEGSGTTIGKCLTFAEIEGLLAAERERCAAVADSLAGVWGSMATMAISREIRNLPPQTEGGKS